MIKKNLLCRASLIVGLVLSFTAASAQDIHFTQFDAMPMVINPAFTGNFDGRLRAAAIYRNQWQSVTIPYVTYGASVDAHIINDLTSDDFLSAGVTLYKDQAGDGNLSNFTGLVSIAYQKFLGISEGKSSALCVGLQGGYAQKSIDLSKLYFGDEYFNGSFNPGLSQEYHLGLGNTVNYYVVNAGISWQQAFSPRFSYIIGVSGNNLNQPNDALLKQETSKTGLDMRLTGLLGMNIGLSDRFTLRPAVLYQTQASATEIIAGNEFHYLVGNPDIQAFSTAVFLGGWYRSGDAAMVTAGVEFKGFRVGVSYDYNISALNTASNGNGGFEISLKYIMPNPLDFAHKRTVPCNRF